MKRTRPLWILFIVSIVCVMLVGCGTKEPAWDAFEGALNEKAFRYLRMLALLIGPLPMSLWIMFVIHCPDLKKRKALQSLIWKLSRLGDGKNNRMMIQEAPESLRRMDSQFT